ncbi:MAG TPA: cellulase family glycosylhydrolase [Nevskiaceae bacterium]|nr:cellulase family glycosylhydrolase [Nevskiaceae bacterium]
MTKRLRLTSANRLVGIVVVVAVAVAGLSILAIRAAGPFASVEVESTALAGTATQISDTTASGGKAIKFGNVVTTPPTTGNRSRVKVQNNSVVTDKGTLLRMGTLWYLNPSLGASQADFAKQATTSNKLWDTLKAGHFNGVRIAVASNAGSDSPSMAQTTAYLDQMIAKADSYSMYVVIDLHVTQLNDTGGAGDYNMAKAQAFWATVAPRYAGKANVLYELHNEPVAWTPADYDSKYMADQKTLYTQMRTAAPDTHIILFSFAVPQNWGNDSPSMADLAKQYNGTVDWTKTSVGFHAYHTTSSAPWVNLKKSFPTINTEFMGPSGEVTDTAYDGTRWTSQAFEQQGVSWMAWNVTSNSSDLTSTLTDLLNDAKTKNYWWAAD